MRPPTWMRQNVCLFRKSAGATLFSTIRRCMWVRKRCLFPEICAICSAFTLYLGVFSVKRSEQGRTLAVGRGCYCSPRTEWCEPWVSIYHYCSCFPVYSSCFSHIRSEQERMMLLFLAFNVRQHTNNHIKRGGQAARCVPLFNLVIIRLHKLFEKATKSSGIYPKKTYFCLFLALTLWKYRNLALKDSPF